MAAEPIASMAKKYLKEKTEEFLSSRKNANTLADIITYFEQCIARKYPLTSSLLTLETIFINLLRRNEMVIEIESTKRKDNETPMIKYREWLQERYREVLQLMLSCFDVEKNVEAIQALVTLVKLMSCEGKHPIENSVDDSYYFPISRFRAILAKLLSKERLNTRLIERFQEYSEYVDVLYHYWKLIPGLTPKAIVPTSTFVKNYLQLMSIMPVTQAILKRKKFLCSNGVPSEPLDYITTRKNINKAWSCMILWEMSKSNFKRLLIVLLEKIFPHLEKPILTTDFLMDSLDVGGSISLLALQGVFILMQENNITYHNIFEKLYSMFEPEIFHTKYKARLFYLSEMFLRSSLISENLVAAFVKRLARLSLTAPSQDVVVIIYFIGNLILRHPGLKRLTSHPTGGEVLRDPYIMDERDPLCSHAMTSSLWEIISLQSHANPSIANAAKLISRAPPTTEWDISSFFENREDIFDQEIISKSKEFALAFERPKTHCLPQNEVFLQH